MLPSTLDMEPSTLDSRQKDRIVKAKNPEYNIPAREKKTLEHTAFWHEVKVVCCLPTPFLRSFICFEHFGRITALLAGSLTALWIIIFARYCVMIKDLHNTWKASKYCSLSILSLHWSATTISVSWNRLQRCARTPHARAPKQAAPLPFK